MTDLSFNINRIKLELKNSEFIEATISQINKDLNGIHQFNQINLSKKNEPILAILIDDMCQIIQVLLEMNKLQQFLYSVDLDESISSEYSFGNLTIKELSFQIIKRESYKVFLRNFYSKKID